MAKCPKCKSAVKNAKKQWNYAQFTVKAFTCGCGQDFREYSSNNEIKFILIKSKTSPKERIRWKKVKP